jgi:Holliday junction resolvase
MPNKNYLKGVRKERAIVNEAREKGLIAFRSAGSHSPIDVCVIDMSSRRIEFIQCKPDSMSDKKKEELEKELQELNYLFQCSFKVQ